MRMRVRPAAGPPRPAVRAPPAQVRDRKSDLAQWETIDMGKPIDEAEWDMVGPAGAGRRNVGARQAGRGRARR
jgi:acyl-CoA reductase-like NAD-dependent aldehyde dehydrogenase